MITPPHIKDRDAVLAKWQPVIDKTFDIFSWTSGHELSFLAECASQARNICEIGSYHGKSAVCMTLANPDASILAIDLPQDDRCEQILGVNTANSNINVWSGTSSDFIFTPYHKFQFAFIDGGHTEELVTNDINNLRPHMAPGAIMSGHDWRPHDMNDGVNQAVIKAFGMPNVYESIWWVRIQ